MSDEKARLFSAFAWYCPACDEENYTRAIDVEDPELIEELRESINDEAEGFLMQPDQVKCKACGNEFEVECELDEEDDE